VSAASAWELAIKYQQGKLCKAANLVSDFSIRIDRQGFQLLPISAEHGIRAGLLSGPLKDPFDRMLIAQSQAGNTPIISNGAILERYEVGRLRWHRLHRLRKKYGCHSERSEESLCALDLNRREILRFAQNDTKTEFFRSLFSLWGSIGSWLARAS